ncbi:MAG: MaoC/PaaZ C-terminal domain-containing protein [Pseudomonadota bacterium]
MSTFDYAQVLTRVGDITQQYDEDRVILYALGVGYGLEHTDPNQLRFVTETDLDVPPSFATVASWHIDFTLELGIAWSNLIHAAQKLVVHAPMPRSATVRARTRTVSAFRKRAGTLLINQTEVIDAVSNQKYADLEATMLARDCWIDGAPEGGPPSAPPLPKRHPDRIIDLPTSRQVALIYRLLGGRSLIHCDPVDAEAHGFDGPIMHGLSTWGHACHAVLASLCDYRVERLQRFEARFSAPVYPGETLRTELWQDDDGAWRFTTSALERETVVLSEGCAHVR